MGDNLIMDKNELVKMLINQTPIAYIIMDENNRIHFVNESFLKLRGLEWDKTVGELCYNISNGGKHCQYCSISLAMESGCKTMLQRKDILPNGAVRYIDDYAVPLYRNPKTGLTYLLEIMVNRSEEMQELEQCNKDLENLVKTLVLILEAKDAYTAIHSQNVQKYATKIARQLQLPDNEVFHISLAALLHDIGKIQIPLDVLNKPAKLTDEEYNLIKSHPVKACEILDGLMDLDDIMQMVRHHHERIDGKGYPDGLNDESIDLGSRILAVADTYDAMTTDRCYRKALSRETAIAELKNVIGSQLDSDIVNTFSAIPEEALNDTEDVQTKHSLLVRALKNDSINDVHKELVVDLENMQENMDTDKMLNIIFENTPCGYVLVDEKGIVKFANDYTLSLFGYKDEDFLNSRCDLFVKCEEDQVRSDCIRVRRDVPSGTCIFDLYHSEISDNTDSYDMYVLLDRTKEVSMREKLQRSYMRLVNILHNLINEELFGADMTSKEKLNDLQQQAETLASRYQL